MAEEDIDLKLLELKKMRELRSKLARESRPQGPAKKDPLELLRQRLVERGNEVLDAALNQYPNETRRFLSFLARLVEKEGIDRIDGETLYSLLRSVGIPVKLETKLMYLSKGKLKSIGDLVKEKY